MNEETRRKLQAKPAPYNCVTAQDILKHNGYIKGYGAKARVMDKDHNPVVNITKGELDWLEANNLILQENNVWIYRK